MLDLRLQPAANEAEFSDDQLVGEWAEALPKMLAEPQIPPWCSYSVQMDGRVAGLGAFKGSPDETGAVEIAYLTMRPEQGRGVATAV